MTQNLEPKPSAQLQLRILVSASAGLAASTGTAAGTADSVVSMGNTTAVYTVGAAASVLHALNSSGGVHASGRLALSKMPNAGYKILTEIFD
jgi:hypothetical protein